MKTSCGVIIINEFGEILLGHSTGNRFYDIPKGGLEEGEGFIDCARRECIEETGLSFHPDQLDDLGLFPYNSVKQLYLFMVLVQKEKVKFADLSCKTFFKDSLGRYHPEFDSYLWAPVRDLDVCCTANLSKVLNTALTKICLS